MASEDIPIYTYDIGDRVRISTKFTWARGATGTVDIPPVGVDDILVDDIAYEGRHRRIVSGRKGPIEMYWVVSDEPQIDADGDGPYAEAEFAVDEIEPIAPNWHGTTAVQN